jgi:hypothetical protein
MIQGAVYTPEGKVVIRYEQPMPKAVQLSKDNVIVFDCQHGVSLAFVNENIVPQLLAVKGGCCGGQHQIITLASEVAYSHWQNGLGGR